MSDMRSTNAKNKGSKRKSVTIAIMGPTGSGKTSFINLVSGSELRVGMGLESATDSIQVSQPFTLDKYLVTLVDTPGFDDTTKSDVDILTIISDYLASAFKNKVKINGIIYLHRISDNRMGGTALRNFKMFMQLCGPQALKNAAIVLNMWNEVNEDVRKAREAELITKETFFQPAVKAGAQVFHHENTVDSAREILLWLAKRPPKPLLIQKELVVQRKQIGETAAGIALLGELAARERKHAEQLREMQREIDEAIKKKDDEDRRELEDARRKLEQARNSILKQQQKIQATRRRRRGGLCCWKHGGNLED